MSTHLLSQCPACEGFLPPSAALCPHCPSELASSAPWDGPTPRFWRGLQRTVVSMATGALTVTSGGFVALTLMACYGMAYNPAMHGPGPEAPACVPTAEDEDGDCVKKADDCDDNNAFILPGAEDPEGDGVDQNCDGVDGLAPTEPTDEATPD